MKAMMTKPENRNSWADLLAAKFARQRRQESDADRQSQKGAVRREELLVLFEDRLRPQLSNDSEAEREELQQIRSLRNALYK